MGCGSLALAPSTHTGLQEDLREYACPAQLYGFIAYAKTLDHVFFVCERNKSWYFSSKQSFHF
jgi:hypothetical protein